MAADTREPVAGRRLLNPLVFPTDTTFRFVLLVVAVISASLWVYEAFYFGLPSTVSPYQRCAEEAGRAAQAVPADASRLDSSLAAAKAEGRCLAPFDHKLAAFEVGGVAILLFVAVVLYLVTPSWKIRRRRLVPLLSDDAPGVVDCLQALCASAGLSRIPTLLWNPLRPDSDALAFGRLSRSYVAVGVGLVSQFYSDRDTFVSIIQHEIGHLANRDITKTYLTVGVWHAFIVVGMLPLVLLDLITAHLILWREAWRLAALTGLIYLVRNSILRSREHYADIFALKQTNRDDSEVLERVIEHLPPARRVRAANVHPDPGERLYVLRDTARLFRLSPWDALSAAAVAGFALPTLEIFVGLYTIGTRHGLVQETAASLVAASILGAVVGAGISRATFAARALRRPFPAALPLAVAVAVGVAVGKALSFDSPSGWPSFSGLPYVIIAMLVFLHWVIEADDAWIGLAAKAKSRSLLSWIPAATAALTAWTIAWLSYVTSPLVGISGTARFVALDSTTIPLLITIIVCSVVPLLSRTSTGASSTPAWAFLPNNVPPGRESTVANPSELKRVIGRALLVATGFSVTLVTLHVLGVSPRVLVRPVDHLAFSYGYAGGTDYSPVAFAVLAEFIVAGIVSFRVGRLPALHALASVWFCAFGMVGVIVAMDASKGPGYHYANAWIALRLVLTGGTAAALIMGELCYALRRFGSGAVAVWPSKGASKYVECFGSNGSAGAAD